MSTVAGVSSGYVKTGVCPQFPGIYKCTHTHTSKNKRNYSHIETTLHYNYTHVNAVYYFSFVTLTFSRIYQVGIRTNDLWVTSPVLYHLPSYYNCIAAQMHRWCIFCICHCLKMCTNVIFVLEILCNCF